MKAANWGLPTVNDPAYCWGARAIWSPGRMIDIVWDRQGWGGEHTFEERNRLSNWWNRARDVLEARLRELGVDGSSEEVVTVAGDGYRCSACPRRSFGYLYLVVEPDPSATEPLRLPPKDKPKRRSRAVAH